MSVRLRLPARVPSLHQPLRRGLAIAGMATIVATGAAACGGGGAPSDAQLYKLRMCESGGNYGINSGNGFYGAYQFDLGTWHSLGYGGAPNQASPATQDSAVRKLYASRGWSPWPSCGRRAA